MRVVVQPSYRVLRFQRDGFLINCIVFFIWPRLYYINDVLLLSAGLAANKAEEAWRLSPGTINQLMNDALSAFKYPICSAHDWRAAGFPFRSGVPDGSCLRPPCPSFYTGTRAARRYNVRLQRQQQYTLLLYPNKYTYIYGPEPISYMYTR